MESPDEGVEAWGEHRRFTRPPRGTALEDILAEPGGDGRCGAPAVLVGALPFAPGDEAHLVQPLRWTRLGGASLAAVGPSAAPAIRVREIRPEPTRGQFEGLVEEVVRRIGAEGDTRTLRKVVLARRLVVDAMHPIDIEAVVSALRGDPGTTVFQVALPPSLGGEARAFVGATPELLVERRGRRVRSAPLAGSAPRSAEPGEDRTARDRLLASAKDRHEHALVVERVMDTLAPLCRHLPPAPAPVIAATSSLWHLCTPIEGVLRDPRVSALDLAGLLHPTPAVCGVPTPLARQVIAETEPFSRGFYGGAVGWCEAGGDGRWMVSIRCAEIEGRRAILHAGAGIVPGSRPEAEAEETSVKFAPLLGALGLQTGAADGEGRP